MKAYITYKFKDEDPKSLKAHLEEFSRVVEEATGWKTFVFFRDIQKWQKDNRTIGEIFNQALSEVKKCDIILAEASEKSNGAYLEIGYGKALGKKIVVVHKTGTEANLLDAMADVKFTYDNYEDLKKKLKGVKI
jgi:nucleoside 2-deoxyribosyltransferase